MKSLPEFWLRGPVSGVPELLQPLAHALLQSRQEVTEIMQNFPERLLWTQPAGLASPGFHLKHLKGVLDRLFTYAKGSQLSPSQLKYLSSEGDPVTEGSGSSELVDQYSKQIDLAIAQLRQTDVSSLTEFRGVGRKQLPSTVLGLLTHAAEHCMRHTGQLLVTVRILKTQDNFL